VTVKPSPLHGLGVFADDGIDAGQVVEVCPVIPAEPEAIPALAERYYPWLEGRVAVVLGFGMIYNHSYEPNASYLPAEQRDSPGVMVYTAIRRIEAGEEITVNYTGTPTGAEALWFDATEAG
jgi:SET domain-containing protein